MVFDEVWSVVKIHPNYREARRIVEEEPEMPMPPPITGLSGTKTKKHYLDFLTDAYRRTGSKELFEPFFGGGGSAFAIRPPKAYLGNDWNQFIIHHMRTMRDKPRALRWKPQDHYTIGVDEPRRFPAGPRPSSPYVELPSVSEQEVRDWHEITGGMGLDEDRMYSVPLRFMQMRRRVNEIAADPHWRNNERKSDELARLIGILQPQMIGGHFRIRDHEGAPTINIPGRGISTDQYLDVMRKYPEAHDTAVNLGNLMAERWPTKTGASAPKILHPTEKKKPVAERDKTNQTRGHTFMPHRPQRFTADEPLWEYDPWSKEMRDKDYTFHSGDFQPFLTAALNHLDLEEVFGVADPPYMLQGGEHASAAGDRGQPGGLTHNLMTDLRPFTIDNDVPMVMFNSPHVSRELYDLGGFDRFTLQTRKEKGVQAKAKDVVETVGTANIPDITQDLIDEMQRLPHTRAAYRQTAFGLPID